ncbi:MAG: mechanosensitive ion channel, partial [Lentisphaerae bacterium]|nr:mechanosensitive ion channel [Lentisphaerota bacterium]
ALSKPATDMLQSLMLAVPKILSAAIILAVAFFVGRFVTTVVSDLLKNLGVDAVPGKLGLESSFSGKFTLSKVIGGVVMFFIMLAALVSAVEKLEMAKLSELLGQLTLFAGDIALGLVILVIGGLLAKAAHGAMRATGTSPFMAGLARVAIIGLVVAMGLRSMGIADDIVRMAFGLTLGGVAVAFALSFGLGGREAAGKQLEDWFSKIRGK